MAKEEIIKFPKWKPNRINKMYFDIYKRFRNSCSGFIAKKEVRDIILKNIIINVHIVVLKIFYK